MHTRPGGRPPGGPATTPPVEVRDLPHAAPRGRRVLVVALGTRGDVEPAVRLGAALEERGDQVVVATLADGAERVERAGLTPLVVGPPAAQAMWWRSPWARGVALHHPGAMYLQTRSRLSRHAAGIAALLAPALTRADLVVCGLATAGLVPVLLRAGVPSRLVLHAPLLPHPGGTSAWDADLGGLLPRPVEAGRQALMWTLTKGLSASLAREVGRRLTRAPGPGPCPRPLPPLLSTSPVLDPDPSPGLLQTGWWADPSPVLPLPDEADAWLSRHPGAVLLSLGSLAQHDAEAQVDQLLRVARASGVPAVVQVLGASPGLRETRPGAAGGHDPGGRRGPDALVLPWADHRALMPRVRAVVHHGGSGTTHAAVAAGRAQLVVPRLGDQPHYGRQVHRLGLGPVPVPHTRVSVPALTRAVQAMLGNPTHTRRAAAAAVRMTGENGLARAVAELAATGAGVPPGAVR